AQVAIDLSVQRGTTSLTVLKAEKRSLDNLGKPHKYWTKDLNVKFDRDKRTTGRIDLGIRLKTVRTKRGLSQTELAKLVGVTPSTISQVESNIIYPSLPALLKMAEILSVDVSSFFQEQEEVANRVIFPSEEAVEISLPTHFFIHKGEEVGYVLSGKLQMKLGKAAYSAHTGDFICLTSEMPAQWRNPGKEWAKLLWFKVK
ncbi:MAG: XRE family transcriptional regulator, partial [Deltaproteobacteria bacterium]